MKKGKPVLKRSFPISSPRRHSSWLAFSITAILVIFMAFILIRTHTHSSTAKKSASQTKQNTNSKPQHVYSQTNRNNSSKIIPTQTQTQTRNAKIHPVPETLVIEKDSISFPGRAPRLDHKEPMALPPSNNLKIDWKKPVIVFVIDDIGHEVTYDAIIDRLGNKITYAILPHLKYSKFYGEKSRSTGADVILHLPLESERGIYPGPGLITRFMPEDVVRRMVGEHLDSIPNQIGANNHMGSLGTSDPGFMTIILQEFKKRNLFFLDSFTSPRSQVVPISRSMHVPVLRRDVFLDNVEQPEPIRQQIAKTAQVAAHSGYAIAIGHYKKYTLQVIAEEIPKLEKQGYQFVKLSDLMKRYN